MTKGAALAQAAGLPKMFAGEFAPIFEALDNAYTAYSAKAFDLGDDISPEEEEALFSKTNFLKTAEAKKILSEKGPLGELIKKYNLNSSFFTDIMKDKQLQAWNDIEDQLEAEQEKKQKYQKEKQRAEEFARQEQEAENQQYKIISARFRVTHNKNGEPLNKPYWSKDYQYAFANRSGQAIKP